MELDAKCYNFNVKLNRSNIRMFGLRIDMLQLIGWLVVLGLTAL